MPLLTKFIREAQDLENATHKESVKSTYIQSVATKYTFPLDEDEIYESDYIKRDP